MHFVHVGVLVCPSDIFGAGLLSVLFGLWVALRPWLLYFTGCGLIDCGVIDCGFTDCGFIVCGFIECGLIGCGFTDCGFSVCGFIGCGFIECGFIDCGIHCEWASLIVGFIGWYGSGPMWVGVDIVKLIQLTMFQHTLVILNQLHTMVC